jgi:hypothetical protein
VKDIAQMQQNDSCQRRTKGNCVKKENATIRKNNNLRVLTSGTGIGKEHVKGM